MDIQESCKKINLFYGCYVTLFLLQNVWPGEQRSPLYTYQWNSINSNKSDKIYLYNYTIKDACQPYLGL